ncbi:cytochrome P450, partial [Lophiotrema nucula]
KYANEPFTLIDHPLTIVILPESSINELKDVSPEIASFRNFLYVYWHGRYSYIGQYSHATESAVKTGMNRDVNTQLVTLADETRFAIPKMLPACEDGWEEIQLSTVLTKVVAYVTFRSFVGLPLSREDAWIEATTNYATTLSKFSAAVRESHWSLRWLARPVHWFRTVRPHQQQFVGMLAPIVAAAKRAKQDREQGLDAEPPRTLIEWMISYNKMKDVSASKITGAQLTASFAAIHSTTGLVEHVLLDLAARPDDAQALRDELTEHAPDGNLDKVAISKLWKLDSFIKESQRCNPATAFHMLRLTSSPLQISPFPPIPANTNVAISAPGTSGITSYDNRDAFDGFRHARARAAPDASNKHQLVTTGPTATSFGHGPHACPGRYFAANEIKVLIAELLTRYDLKFAEGMERPRNMLLPGGAVFADPGAKVLFRGRK